MSFSKIQQQKRRLTEEVWEETGENTIYHLCKNKETFAIVRKRDTKIIAIKKKNGAWYDFVKFVPLNYYQNVKKDKNNPLKEQEIASFFSMISKKINDYIQANNYDVKDLYSNKSHEVVTFDNKVFCGLADQEPFWVFDIDNAYWQAMYYFGIISENIYRKYWLMHDYYKNIKAVAAGLGIAEKETIYYRKGNLITDNEKITQAYTISECKWQWRNLYENIRNWCYNQIWDCLAETCITPIYYNQDALAVRFEDYSLVIDWLNKHDIQFKIIQARKINDEYYSVGGKIVMR